MRKWCLKTTRGERWKKMDIPSDPKPVAIAQKQEETICKWMSRHFYQNNRQDSPKGCRLWTPEVYFICKRTSKLGPHKANETPLIFGKEFPASPNRSGCVLPTEGTTWTEPLRCGGGSVYLSIWEATYCSVETSLLHLVFPINSCSSSKAVFKIIS